MTVWMHSTKGQIEGDVVRVDETWTTIRLSAPAWADVRHRHKDDIGDVRQYRTSRLRELAAEPDDREEDR